jgi:hypothetical protein
MALLFVLKQESAEGLHRRGTSADVCSARSFARSTWVPPPGGTVEGGSPVSRNSKPSVFQVGKIRDDGHTVVISGWGLGLCAAGCACHRHPLAGHLAIEEDQAGGRLGLASYREDGCDCCEPWTADELAAILRDLSAVESLEAQEPLAG